ncbi:hypothetical protein SAMN05216559_3833 [Halomicrobium zhouii]|uniref:Uncharacterized protein n=1 Tax=Halomicrobium zhouii TaxID=767519 RepID=A0A1I6M6H6_9EURY|nr:hypothetical protein [Halomicrobium zhouii]SFS11319.1 hypothetical protein SAMN05216559_3833 [Halomicrobium zhouii]
MTEHTRRRFVQLAGATTVGITGTSATALAQSDGGGEWAAAESPTDKPLNDVVDTTEGPFAVGGGGDVLGRFDDGWQKVVEYGPQARSRPLTGVDVTDGGNAIWFVGGSGVIGEYNVATKTLTNYSAPKGKTSTWEDCAVRGTAGENERLYFVNGSGELLVGDRQDSGAVKYQKVIKPGGGSTIPGIDFHSRSNGHVCSTSQYVAQSTDGGESWNQIGIDFAGTSFFDVASVGRRDVNVAAGNGIVYRYDGHRWTPHVVDGGRQSIRSVDRTPDAGVAAGDGGKVYDRTSTGQWERFQTPVKTKLRGVAYGTSGVDVAVGNNGEIVERVRDGSGDATTETETATATASPTANGTATATPNGTETATAAETATETTEASIAPEDRIPTLANAPQVVENYREGIWV